LNGSWPSATIAPAGCCWAGTWGGVTELRSKDFRRPGDSWTTRTRFSTKSNDFARELLRHYNKPTINASCALITTSKDVGRERPIFSSEARIIGVVSAALASDVPEQCVCVRRHRVQLSRVSVRANLIGPSLARRLASRYGVGHPVWCGQ